MKKLLAMGLAVLLGLAGCGDREEAEVSLDPVAFHSEDECHVCGTYERSRGQVVRAVRSAR